MKSPIEGGDQLDDKTSVNGMMLTTNSCPGEVQAAGITQQQGLSGPSTAHSHTLANTRTTHALAGLMQVHNQRR